MSIFTAIRLGNEPGEVVWEDEHCFALLVISPLNEGHLVVCPIAEHGDWETLPPETLTAIHLAAARLARAMTRVWNPPHVASVWAGFDIPDHAHLHVFPAYRDTDIDWLHFPPRVSPDALAAPAAKLRAALSEEDES